MSRRRNNRKNGDERRRNESEHRTTDRAAFIAELLREFPDRKFSLKQLASASGGNDREGRAATAEILVRMVDERFVEECSRGRYRLSTGSRPELEGTVSTVSSGAIFVRVEGAEEDIYVSRRHAHNALDGDTVRVVILKRRRDGSSPEGAVVGIVRRSGKTYVGVASLTNTSIFVTPDSKRIAVDIHLSKKLYSDVRDGDKVAVRIVSWDEGTRLPEGEIVDILGPAGDNDTEMHAILAEYDLPYRFDEEVAAAAEAMRGEITDEERASRRDFRGVTTFTVDPADAKDFDDALSIRKTGDGVWEVGVHIADVTHYVTPGSVIDAEAAERGTSVYLVDRTVPMLPERLSNELCSLRPHEESLCFSAVFTLDENLEIRDEWFGRTVIYSDHRFSYEQAQQVIETCRGEYAEEITTLNRLAEGLRRERFRHGAIAFERDEVRFKLDEHGHPIGVYVKEQKEANRMIEEFMLLANRRVAEFCGRRMQNGRRVQRTMVYRVHDEPNEEKLTRFREFITRFGYSFRASKGRAVAKQMNRLMGEVHDRPEANAITTLAVRSMAKAFYTTDNIGHYGLAFPYYTHFTSPIRRYPDMMVHRLLAHYLAGGKSADKHSLEEMCAYASDREIVASEAERASIKYKMVEFMRDKIGQEFDGWVSGISELGIFVELNDTHVEGMAFLRDIEDDFYRFDEARYEVVGRAHGRTFTLGTPVRVRVKSADLRRRTLDFEIVL